ncbi:MAG: restriction endonuclease [Pedobacter sp.]|nr:restriction endonuclease [Pedobacter sp.]
MSNNLLKVEYRQEIIGIYRDKVKYIVEITHGGLNDYKVISSYEQSILLNKVNSYVAKLEDKWDNIVSKKLLVKSKEEILKEAEFQTKLAKNAIIEVENVLLKTLTINDVVNWEKLKDKRKYPVPRPKEGLSVNQKSRPTPQKPKLLKHPAQPNPEDFKVKLSFLDRVFTSVKEEKIQKAERNYAEAFKNWKSSCNKIDVGNRKLMSQFDTDLSKHKHETEKLHQSHLLDIKNWERDESTFYNKQKQDNLKVDELKNLYLQLDPSAIVEYCDLVLNNSEYPENFPKSFEIEYQPDSKILIVDYSLPSLEQFPTISEVKVIKGELKTYQIPETQKLKMFDTTMYNITLRTIHELFEADVIKAIDAISFNGWVYAVNKATGKHENNCILSIQVKQTEFVNVDLRHVDPKTCFKNLKGVASSKLSGLTAIKPIMSISRSDKRFVNHQDVAHLMDSSTNLASMDWEDFEHLIREIFEKEFSSNGGEVKVTQASRDGGVDAIAFDPDPIRGGKIVIQAKRYTNTVGVAAVRDLFGTVLNEGATKGILVTTSDYGPDAYNFANGKPLTLMNGSNLLYLLEKHGHHARINIKEARENMR